MSVQALILDQQAQRKSLALAKRFSGEILRLNPGLGEKAAEVASMLAEAGLPPALNTQVLLAVYDPSNGGRGQTQRAQWMSAAVVRRYGDRLSLIRSSVASFRAFLMDVTKTVDDRDTLQGEDLSVSYEEAFLLAEVGYGADEVLAVREQFLSHLKSGTAKRIIVQAAMAVQRGECATLESAVEALCYT